MAPRRGWVGWIQSNPLLSGGLSLTLVIAIVGVVVVVNRSGEDGKPIAVGTEPSPLPGETALPGESPSPGATPTGPAATLPPGVSIPTALPGVVPPPATVKEPAKCTPRQPRAANGRPETGITNTTIKIGQIVSDSANLPAQLFPNYEGLSAYVKQVNDAGGVCRRKIEIVYENDNSNPTTHRYEQLAQQVFAFVANSSLLDSVDYETSPPFNPEFRDEATNEFVPDIGGLAYAYGRNQSNWFAGALGSLSPVLAGGGAFRGMLQISKAEGRPCRKMGLAYLIEPTGASEDQARLGKTAFEADWGGDLGEGNVTLYQSSLAAPSTVYRGIVRNMIRDGMNCVGTYMDLQSDINLVIAMAQEGVWPPGKCTRADKSECFNLTYLPFAAYDAKVIRDVEAAVPGASRLMTTFLPHVPLNETGHPAMKAYVAALDRCKKDSRYPQCRDAEPSTFSIIGYVSGIMLVDALRSCGEAPTRRCVMSYLRGLKNFTGAGVLGAVSPFKCTRARDGSSHNWGVWCWKWIFTNTVTVRVEGTEKNLIHRFHRIRPASGFAPDALRIVRGSPA